MKIQSVTHNNRKRAFQVKMSKKVFPSLLKGRSSAQPRQSDHPGLRR